MEELKWMDEKVEHVEHSNWLYKFCCLMLFKRKEKLSYKDLYLIIYGINRRALGYKEAEKFSLEQILKIYKYNNNRLPDMKTNE